MNIHTLWFHPQIKELSALLRDRIAVPSRYLQWKDFQKNEPYAHWFCACDLRAKVYKYYIPERVLVRMFTLRKWLSTEAKPRSIIIFEGWTFLLLPSQECTIYFIKPKLLSGKKRYVNGAGEEDAAF